MRGLGQLRRWRTISALVTSSLFAGCSFTEGPPRLFTVAEETAAIRAVLPLAVDPLQFSRMDEATRVKYRNDWIAGRMYAIDIQYTGYEADLTRERQAVGFGAATTALGLSTAAGLLTPVVTKNVLTGTAAIVTGTRAAYDSDVLLAHSIQWIQNQMRTERAYIADRIFNGMKLSTAEYSLAAAATDLEDYYRAGTFTGGIVSTSSTLGEAAALAEQVKQDKIQVAYVSTAAGKALARCLHASHPGVTLAQQKARLIALMPTPSSAGFELLILGQSPAVAQDVLQRATNSGFCP